jgi:DNA mismatch repair ATPase MutS
MKLQSIVKKFLLYVGNTHLEYTWYDSKPVWNIQLSSTSQLEELASLENMEMRFNLAGTMLDHIPDLEIYTKILKYPEDKARELIKQLDMQKRDRTIFDAVSSREAEIKAGKLAEKYNLPPEEALTTELRLMMMHNPNLRTAVQSLVEVNKQLLEKSDAKKSGRK